MSIDFVFMLFLLGHIAGDFYTQWGTMAAEKATSRKRFAVHGALYAACMAVALFGGIEYSNELLWVFLIASVSHPVVDFCRRFFKTKAFMIDQIIHFIILVLLWFTWGECMKARDVLLDFRLSFLPENPLLVLLGLLLIILPVGCLIGSGDIWDFEKSPVPPKESQKGAGRMIGYLERIIVFFLLLNGQLAAIGFVIAAKSIIRFPEIREQAQKERTQAEYYLIGTLLSMVAVFSTTLLLGLIKL